MFMYVCVFILHPIVLFEVSFKRRVPNQGRTVAVVQTVWPWSRTQYATPKHQLLRTSPYTAIHPR